MTEDKINIHLLQSPTGYFFYDVFMNKIVQVDAATYDLLARIVKREIDIDDECASSLAELRKDRFLSDFKIEKIEHPQTKDLPNILNRNIKMLTLQVTQKCNFRCSYCVYSELDHGKQRAHSAAVMSEEVAFKAVDYYIAHSRDEKLINIGFYGGEPLLEFELIKKVIAYVECKGEGKEVMFSFTTNGSLMNREIIAYCLEKKISMTLSMDGPEEIHNKHRRFSHNGGGTFRTIADNLNMIRKEFPEYLKYIGVNVVIDPQNDLDQVNKLFYEDELFEDINFHSSTIDDVYSDEKTFFSEEYTSKYEFELFKAYMYYLKRISKTGISPIALERLNSLNDLKNKMKNITGYSKTFTHAGPCVPGKQRLFVTVNGNFYPCERVSESSSVMKIGDIHQGIDIGRAETLLNVGKLTEKKCKKCVAIHDCKLCAKQADNGEELSGGLKSLYCKGVEDGFLDSLLDIIMLTELGKREEDTDD